MAHCSQHMADVRGGNGDSPSLLYCQKLLGRVRRQPSQKAPEKHFFKALLESTVYA